jgi:hypothetical protein
VALLAVATPLGLAAYSISKNIYIPRNMSASLPALWLLIAAGLTTLRRPLMVGAAAAVSAALAIGTVRTLEEPRNRPPYRQAAHFLDRTASPGVLVVEYPLFPSFASAGPRLALQSYDVNVSRLLARHLDIHFRRPHLLLQARGHEAAVWNQAALRQRLLVVSPWDAAHRARQALPPRLSRRFRLVRREGWTGLVPVAVAEYALRGRFVRAARGT